MEALEDKYVKRDGFDEVDRILTIVEESTKEFDRRDTSYKYLEICFYTFLFLATFVAFYTGFQGVSKYIETFIISSSILFSSIYQLSNTIRKRKSLKDKITITTYQATEVIREIVPVLARTEQWSVLQKFELRLRLSRLDISTEKIFGPEFDRS